GVNRGDRVAVILPNGAEAAEAIIAVAAGAVCVPLNPSYAADEWRRIFADLHASALVTRADLDYPSRGIAESLGITMIDVSLPLSERFDACRLPGSATERAVDTPFATAADDAFILLTSGTSSRPKMVPLNQAAACRAGSVVGRSL